MKFVNTNPHRILIVVDGERHQHGTGAEFEATGELAEAFENTSGVVKASSKDADAYRSGQEIERVAGSGSEAEPAEAFDPAELNVADAIAAIERVTDAGSIGEIRKAEKAGKDRKTVLKAIDDRGKALKGAGTLTSDQIPSKK